MFLSKDKATEILFDEIRITNQILSGYQSRLKSHKLFLKTDILLSQIKENIKLSKILLAFFMNQPKIIKQKGLLS